MRPKAANTTMNLMNRNGCRIWAILAVILLLSGCLTPDQGTESDQTNEGDPVGTLPSSAEVRLEGCYTAFGISAIPSAWAETMVPEGFRVRTYAPGQTFAHYGITSCDRAAFNDTVEQDLRYFFANVEVEVLIEEAEARFSVLFLDLHTTSRKFQQVIEDQGGTAHYVEISDTPSSAPGGVDWQINGGDYELMLTAATRENYDSEPEFYSEMWMVGNEAIRFRSEGRHDGASGAATLFGLTAHSLSMSGTTATKTLFGGESAWGSPGFESGSGNYVYTFTGGFRP